jgi:hypothetical protein
MGRLTALARIALILCLGLAFTRPAQGGAGQWTSSGLPGETIYSIATDPIDPLTVYACGLNATYKSSDGGETWTRILGPSYLLVIDPENPSTLYATASGMSKSVDGGRTWFPIEAGLSCPSVTGLAIDPTNPSVLYAGTANVIHSPAQCGGLFRSLNSGSTWQEISEAFVFTRGVAIDPKATSTIYLLRLALEGAQNDLVRTDDGGIGWVYAGIGLPRSNGVFPDPAVQGLVFAASDPGVYVSRDNGENWSPSGLDGMDVTAFLIDPRQPDLCYAGTNDGNPAFRFGVFRSADHCQSWSYFGLAGVPIEALAINARGTRLFAGTDGNGVFSYDVVTRTNPIPGRKRPSTRVVPSRLF